MHGSEIDIVHENIARSYCTREHSQIVLYTRTQPDHIVHENTARSYCTWEQGQIISYMGFNGGKGKVKVNEAVQRVCVVK